jgi:hypothetical protein
MKMILRFLRKVLLIDFVLNIIKSKQLPHLRFAGFLTIFSYMWAIMLLMIFFGLFNALSKKTDPHWIPSLSFAVVCLGFFLLYKHTSKILKSYTEEQVNGFGYLKYINPVAPVIYFTTTFLIIITILNIIMLVVLILGSLLFVILVIVTLGLLLLSDNFKLDNFIYIPKKFFSIEEYFLENVASPAAIIIFLIFIYFLIPFFTSMIVLIQHYRSNTIIKSSPEETAGAIDSNT